ncbi:M15 family metallopeptidase [Desulfoluna spongiiphila]|uniref:D-alanyl-D-alanine dipeptidase n=1 Tax=Desulfoluna spongiiphila TaxID=419481 RepID=A0A1G5E4T9_9BACT|nr:M15 family metallopeptidase [Desulfoluna spongiiphila]SCY21907.1 D-alanyl-D-alanine dipeptidase [Desulfoluna spongiiphila]
MRRYVLFSMVMLLVAGVAYANEVENKFIRAGLVDVHRIDETIQVDLVNSDAGKNYFREDFYAGLKAAYLRKEVAVKLSKAQKGLKARHPEYSLLILDAARPRSVSRLMYDKMKGTRFEKFVANPARGSMHNYGIAVDITIVDGRGNELDMGFTPFRKSRLQLCAMFAMKKLGRTLSPAQRNNRKLLADVMAGAGFLPLAFEWWHFNGMPKAEARARYHIIE